MILSKAKREELARLHGIIEEKLRYYFPSYDTHYSDERYRNCAAAIAEALPDLLETAEFAERAAEFLLKWGDTVCSAFPATAADERFVNARREFRELLSSLPARKEAK